MKPYFCFIIAILVCSTFSIKAQSLKINLDSKVISKKSVNDNQTLPSSEREKWSNKIKPYYNGLKPKSIIINDNDSLQKVNVDIDKKNVFTDTQRSFCRY